MKVVNTSFIPGKVIKEDFGIVKGTVVQSKNIGKDILASLKTIIGGEIKDYTEMLETAREEATNRMIKEAEKLDADAIINVRYGSSSVMNNAAEIIVYGTAVKTK